MWAMRSQASAPAMVCSKSLAATRRLRPSHAKVRSIAQRLGSGLKRADLLGVLDDFDCPATEFGCGIAQLAAAVDAVDKQVPQLGQALPQQAEQRHSADAHQYS